MRFAAALSEGEPKILLTDYFTANSRMMIRRRVRERVQELAGFLQWDQDPYLVITDDGRLVWTSSRVSPWLPPGRPWHKPRSGCTFQSCVRFFLLHPQKGIGSGRLANRLRRRCTYT